MIRLIYHIGLCTILLFLLTFTVTSQNVDYYAKAYKCYLDAKNDSALIYMDIALSTTNDSTDITQKVEMLLLRSRILSNLTFFEPAMRDAIEAHELSEKHDIGSLLSASLLGIGKVYYQMYNDSVSESYFLRAKEQAQKDGCERGLMMANHVLAQLYLVNERNEEAIALINNSLEMAKQHKDTILIIDNLNLLASYYTNLNRWTNPIIAEYQEKTKQYLDEALKLALEQNIPMLILPTYARYVRYYRVEKNYSEALRYANMVIDLCEPTHYTMLIQMYDHLVGIYAHLGDKQGVVNSHQQFYRLMQKQSNYTLHRSLQEMQVKYDVQKKELEIASQQNEIKSHKMRNRFYFAFLITTVITIILLSHIILLRNRHNRLLAETNATKDKLFSIISHDLKSPTMAQKMAVDGMIEELEKRGETQGLTDRLKAFRDATESQLSLLLNLLNWANLQIGKMRYSPIAFNISEVINKSLDLCNISAQNKQLRLITDITDEVLVFADKQMISTVIRNILSNAIKFSMPGNNIYVSVSTEDEMVLVDVTDNGVGMSQKQIDDLLKYDNNVSQEDTSGEKGSGLGLSISKKLLEKNGSKLHIESREGMGTKVFFELQKA